MFSDLSGPAHTVYRERQSEGRELSERPINASIWIYSTYANLSLPQSEETTPFDETTLVYKVAGKMFLLADMTDGRAVNVKCDPDHVIALRERYAEVTPGWHMNKRHWNTVRIDGDLPEKLIREWVVDSYRLVAGSLPKTVRGPLLEALDACAEENEPEKPMNPNR